MPRQKRELRNVYRFNVIRTRSNTQYVPNGWQVGNWMHPSSKGKSIFLNASSGLNLKPIFNILKMQNQKIPLPKLEAGSSELKHLRNIEDQSLDWFEWIRIRKYWHAIRRSGKLLKRFKLDAPQLSGGGVLLGAKAAVQFSVACTARD